MTQQVLNELENRPDNCKLYEMVQYQCETNLWHIECTPFVRLFLKCTGIPTVEVTPEYDQYGEPMISQSTVSSNTKGE